MAIELKSTRCWCFTSYELCSCNIYGTCCCRRYISWWQSVVVKLVCLMLHHLMEIDRSVEKCMYDVTCLSCASNDRFQLKNKYYSRSSCEWGLISCKSCYHHNCVFEALRIDNFSIDYYMETEFDLQFTMTYSYELWVKCQMN